MKGFMFHDRSLILTLRLDLSLGEKRRDAEQNMMSGTGIATEALIEIETRGTGATSGTAEDGNQGPIETAVPTNATEDPTGGYLNAQFFYADISDKCRPLSPQRRPGIYFICFASLYLTNSFSFLF